jgi:hypothetical protein
MCPEVVVLGPGSVLVLGLGWVLVLGLGWVLVLGRNCLRRLRRLRRHKRLAKPQSKILKNYSTLFIRVLKIPNFST